MSGSLIQRSGHPHGMLLLVALALAILLVLVSGGAPSIAWIPV